MQSRTPYYVHYDRLGLGHKCLTWKRHGRLARTKLLVILKSVGGEGDFVPSFYYVLLNSHISRTAATSLTFFHQNSSLVGGKLTHTIGFGVMRWPHSVDSETSQKHLVPRGSMHAGRPRAKSVVVQMGGVPTRNSYVHVGIPT